MNRKLWIAVFLACGLSAQEGEIVQKDKAQRDKQLQERNAQRKTADPKAAQSDKTQPADPTSVGTAGSRKKSETAPPTKPETPAPPQGN